MHSTSAAPVRLVDYRVSDYLIDHVDLDIRLAEKQTQVFARLSMHPNPEGQKNASLELDGDELIAKSVKIDGVEIEPGSQMNERGGLTFKQPPQRAFTLEIETEIDPRANTKLMGLYRSGSAFCTQCEAEGFRRITYFLDRPDVLATYKMRLEAEKAEAPVLLGNGNLVEQGDIAGTSRHYAIWHDPFPKPSYLFALVGGDLGSIHDEFTTMSGRKVRLGIYVEHGKEAQADFAMDALKRSMAWDEKVFKREYDLDVFNIVAVSEFNMGAMENKGLNIFNDKLVLASAQSASDDDYARIESVIAHEYFHNWTGNRITCRDWFQLCLKEGLTVYRDQEFSADERSRIVQRISDVRSLRALQFPEDAGPLAHCVRPDSYHEINNFYTATIYEKGAELIRVLKQLIGADAFDKGIQLYFNRFDGTATTIENFLACFAESSGRDLSGFMRWYLQAGTPQVHVKTEYDAAQGVLRLDLKQSQRPTPGQDKKLPLPIPLAFGLMSADGAELDLSQHGGNLEEWQRGLIEFDTLERRIAFTGLKDEPIVSLLRNFSAPVDLVYEVDEKVLSLQAVADRDDFNRWQAVQSLAMRRLRPDLPACDPQPLLEAFAYILERADQDLAFAAQMLSLPSEANIALAMGKNVDPDAIHMHREGLRELLGSRLHAPLTRLCAPSRQLEDEEDYSPLAPFAARRAAAIASLSLLTAGLPGEGHAIALEWFEAARNMTEENAALNILAFSHYSGLEEVLDRFYHRHKHQPLVIDKWLSTQAMLPGPDTADRVQQLMLHPAFALANPNRVRALIGAFAQGNPTGFHVQSGQGYQLLRQVVEALDPINPQVAARLISALRSWPALEPVRQQRAKAVLEQIAARPSLSPDVKDIVTRSLG